MSGRKTVRLGSATLSVLCVAVLVCAFCVTKAPRARAQGPKASGVKTPARPKLVVMLVVDQMRGDYVDRFKGQWTGGLKRLVEEGAWFRDAAYPYAATETCVGHSTISTGAFPATHGMVSNGWWDRGSQKGVTCTDDPKVKNVGYGANVKGGDSPARMLVPAFADELKFQAPKGTRVVTFSLKARASITLAGHQGDAVTWFDPGPGVWSTSSAYPTVPFVENYAKAHPVSGDYGKTWNLLLPASAYWYDKKAVGAVPPDGAGAEFPHILRGKPGSTSANSSFYLEWEGSPYAETYLTQMAEDAVDKLQLGKGPSTDYLGVSFSSVDYVAHAFGPRSWEVQDELARLDRDLAGFFDHLDKAVGRDNYVVALTADHGGSPIPEDLQRTGVDAGWLNLDEVKNRLQKALDSRGVEKAIAEVGGGDVYFTPAASEKLKGDSAAMSAAIAAIESVPGVADVYRADDLEDRPATENPIRRAEEDSFLKARSGDLVIVPKPYWSWDFSSPGKPRTYGSMHGSPYYYDQHVPVLLMGYGIRAGIYFGTVTPADIAPTFASLCGITLSPRDGHVLGEALSKSTSRSAR